MPLQASDQQWVRLLSDAVSSPPAHRPGAAARPAADATQFASLHPIGTAANIVRLLKLPDGSLQVLLQGAARIRLAHTPSQTDAVFARRRPGAAAPASTEPPSVQVEGLVKNLQSLFQRVVQLSPVLPDEMAIAAANVDDPGRLADFVAANIDLDASPAPGDPAGARPARPRASRHRARHARAGSARDRLARSSRRSASRWTRRSAISTCASSSRRSAKSSAKATPTRPRWPTCAPSWPRRRLAARGPGRGRRAS